RSLSRLTLDRGGPRDLAAIRDGLAIAAQLAARLGEAAPPDEIAAAATDLAAAPRELITALNEALADELPHLKRDGGFIRAGFDGDLDGARKLRDDSRRVIAGLQSDYAAETGIRGLRI